jgi:hypothetical protein
MCWRRKKYMYHHTLSFWGAYKNSLSSLKYIIHIHEILCLTAYNILSSLEYIIHIHEMPCLTSYNILFSLKYIIYIHEMIYLTSYNILSLLEYIIHIHEVTVADFGYPVLGPLVLVLPKLDFEHIWWRLFEKSVVHTKFDIYIFIPVIHAVLFNFRDN